MTGFTTGVVLALTLPLAACTGRDRGVPALSGFGERIRTLSEPAGYFDTDNLISNESSYLHVMGGLDPALQGRAYIGVGPDQNFSYIARLRPAVAYLVDIRRDNMLEHLIFKALFRLSADRLAYLSGLVGREPLGFPGGTEADLTAQQLVDLVEQGVQEVAAVESLRGRVDSVIATFGVDLTAEDWATIDRFHRVFIDAGLGLRFTSFGRSPQRYYPTYRQLLLETDLAGRQASFLASEADYRYVRWLQQQDLVVPVVGDLAGDRAVAAIAEDMDRRGLLLAALYTSNVEYYLMRDGGFDRFAANLARLPIDSSSLIIRSLFNSTSPIRHPQQVAGYPSTQLLQKVDQLLESLATGQIRSYAQLVVVGALDPAAFSRSAGTE